MTKSYSHRIFHHRILFAALVVGLLSILGTRQPVRAQTIGPLEFTPACDECVYGFSWSGSIGADYYEVSLVDPLHSDGHRRIYKGPSTSAIVTVSGTQTVEIRSCNSGGCSSGKELPLIPGTQLNHDRLIDFRLTKPVSLVHEIDEDFTELTVGWPSKNYRAVSVDTTATGQRVCQTEASETIRNMGTRMSVSVAPDITFTVRNREIVEHRDGIWSWFGDIEGDHQGTLALTTDRCGESVYMSIDSDAGYFAVQPDKGPNHVGYEVIVGDRLPDCHAAPITDAPPLFDIIDEPAVEMPGMGNKKTLRSRSVSVDIGDFLDRFSLLNYLIGDDRSYDIARFQATAASIEFFPGEPVPIDLIYGDFLTPIPDYWVWQGCIAGDSGSIARLTVNLSRKTIDVMIEKGNKVISLSSDGSGQYSVREFTR